MKRAAKRKKRDNKCARCLRHARGLQNAELALYRDPREPSVQVVQVCVMTQRFFSQCSQPCTPSSLLNASIASPVL